MRNTMNFSGKTKLADLSGQTKLADLSGQTKLADLSGQTILTSLRPGVTALALGAGLAAMVGVVQAETLAEQDAKYGKAPAAMCVGCHGIDGYKASFPTVYLVPKISGQSQKYIENALQAYRKGERNHPSMKAIAGSLTDADITALAEYYSKNLGAGAPAAK